jgi:hypothetical protein
LAQVNISPIHPKVSICWLTNWLILFSKELAEQLLPNSHRNRRYSSVSLRIPWSKKQKLLLTRL